MDTLAYICFLGAAFGFGYITCLFLHIDAIREGEPEEQLSNLDRADGRDSLG